MHTINAYDRPDNMLIVNIAYQRIVDSFIIPKPEWTKKQANAMESVGSWTPLKFAQSKNEADKFDVNIENGRILLKIDWSHGMWLMIDLHVNQLKQFEC